MRPTRAPCLRLVRREGQCGTDQHDQIFDLARFEVFEFLGCETSNDFGDGARARERLIELLYQRLRQFRSDVVEATQCFAGLRVVRAQKIRIGTLHVTPNMVRKAYLPPLGSLLALVGLLSHIQSVATAGGIHTPLRAAG